MVRSVAEARHASQLTRDHATSAVHYVMFAFDESLRASLRSGPVSLVIDHPAYLERVELSDLTVRELVADITV